mgnify:CR=1 FL=1
MNFSEKELWRIYSQLEKEQYLWKTSQTDLTFPQYLVSRLIEVYSLHSDIEEGLE